MKSWLCCMGVVAVAIFTGAACGDDSSSTGSGGTGATGGTGGTGGSGGSGATDGGGTDGGGASQTEGCVTVYDADKINFTGTASPVYTCTAAKSTRYPDGPNACRNQPDCDMINTPPTGIRGTVRECALGCLDKEPTPGAPEAERIAACTAAQECKSTCVRNTTAMRFKPPGISDACGKCYTEISACSVAFCLSDCSADADAIGCIKCQFQYGCRVPFERCSGIDRPDP